MARILVVVVKPEWGWLFHRALPVLTWKSPAGIFTEKPRCEKPRSCFQASLKVLVVRPPPGWCGLLSVTSNILKLSYYWMDEYQRTHKLDKSRAAVSIPKFHITLIGIACCVVGGAVSREGCSPIVFGSHRSRILIWFVGRTTSHS